MILFLRTIKYLKYCCRLTAFVAKSFHQAKSHIFIDEETIERAINWMIKHQKSDGRFPEMGHVHAKYLQVLSPLLT